jgi:peptide deformylase
MAQYDIRVFGDPVLRTPTAPVSDIDGALKQLVDDMFETMYAAPGVGLAAPQVGVQKRFFVYDVGDGPGVVINPEIRESSGEWVHDEGCLSVPGLFWPITRPKVVHLVGLDIDGNEIEFEADELLARMFQHEVDHLDGTLLLSRLDGDQRKEAMRALRSRTLDIPAS